MTFLAPSFFFLNISSSLGVLDWHTPIESAIYLSRGISWHLFPVASHIFWRGQGKASSLKTKTFAGRGSCACIMTMCCRVFQTSEKYPISPLVVAEGCVLGWRVWAKAFIFYLFIFFVSSASWWLSEWDGPESRGWGRGASVGGNFKETQERSMGDNSSLVSAGPDLEVKGWTLRNRLSPLLPCPPMALNQAPNL